MRILPQYCGIADVLGKNENEKGSRKMEIKVGIIKEPDLNLEIDRLVFYLNSICEGIYFSNLAFSSYLTDREVSYPNSFTSILGKLDKSFDEYEYVLYLTDKQYDNNYYYDELESIIIISFANWRTYTTLPKNNGFIYFICSLFSETIDETERHYVNTGCIYDFLVDKTGIDTGMKKASICPDCYQRIANNKTEPQDLVILHNLNNLMKELSNSSVWGQDIVVYWSSKIQAKQNSKTETPLKSINEINNKDKFEIIINLIKELEFIQVFGLLEAEAKEQNIFNQVVLLQTNWKGLKRDETAGIIDYETSLRIKNRIILGTLEVVNELKSQRK